MTTTKGGGFKVYNKLKKDQKIWSFTAFINKCRPLGKHLVGLV
jgi:hypothetical protein